MPFFVSIYMEGIREDYLNGREAVAVGDNMKEFQKITRPKKRAFLAAYAEVGNVSQAAKIAGIDRQTHYDWKRNDPDYAEAFQHAEEMAADRLEQEARRRAVEGVPEPVFYQGRQVGTVRKYSDSLLMFLLKGAKPEKYMERVDQRVSGRDGGPVEVKHIGQLDDEQLDQIILEKLESLSKAGTAGTD